MLGMRLTMSYIPAAIALVMALIIWAYPLTTRRMEEINKKLEN